MEQADRDLKARSASAAGQITDVRRPTRTPQALAETGARLYRYLRRQPEKIPSAHRFLTYYLDTVGRILGQYVAYPGGGAADCRRCRAFQRKVRAHPAQAPRPALTSSSRQLMASERFDAEADMKVMEGLLTAQGLLTAEGPMTADEPQNTEEFQWKTRQSSWDC